jgi:hypothetical protein
MAVSLPLETDPRRVRVWALTQVLKAHGYAVEVAESEPLLVVPAAFGPPVQVHCHPRWDCDGELWFSFVGGEAIVQADDEHLPDAVVVVKGKLAAQAEL